MAVTRSPVLDVGSAANVLLLAPTMNVEVEAGCGVLLDAASTSGNALLSVITVESPEDLLRTWHAHVSDDPPEKSAFVVLGGAEPTVDGPVEDGTRTIHPIKHPSNLTDIGVATTTYLSQWDAEDRSIVCCFRSITMLLQYVSSEVMFRFLHQFTQQVTEVGGVAHFHMDPTAHDERIVNTLLTLFDAVAELDDDGEWQVRSRSLG